MRFSTADTLGFVGTKEPVFLGRFSFFPVSLGPPVANKGMEARVGSGRQRRQLFEEQLFTDEFLLIVIYKKDYQFEKNIKKKNNKNNTE